LLSLTSKRKDTEKSRFIGTNCAEYWAFKTIFAKDDLHIEQIRCENPKKLSFSEKKPKKATINQLFDYLCAVENLTY
jgi:hypothetical protein